MCTSEKFEKLKTKKIPFNTDDSKLLWIKHLFKKNSSDIEKKVVCEWNMKFIVNSHTKKNRNRIHYNNA